MPRIGSVTPQKYVRKPNIRVTARNNHLRFEKYPVNDDIYPDAVFHDVSEYENGFFQAATFDDDGLKYLAVRYVADPNSLPTTLPNWDAWTNTGIEVSPYGQVGVYGCRVFYLGIDNDAYYVDCPLGVVDTPVSFYAHSGSYVAFAPVSETELYMQMDTAEVGPYSLLLYKDIDGGTELWHGRIYGEDRHLTCFDAIRNQDKDYIFFADSENKRTLYVTRTTIWSDACQLIPLDVVDETSMFIVGGASVINNKVFVSGVIHRDSHNPMHIYSYEINPGHFSLGREMFIRSGQTQEKSVNFGESPYLFRLPPGKIMKIGDNIWYVGLQIGWYAFGVNFVGVEQESYEEEITAISQLSLSQGSNAPGILNIGLAYKISSALIKSGAELTVEHGYNDDYVQLGIFDIDMANLSHDPTGQQRGITATSKAMKMLSQWEPDASYDYLSQTKVAETPGTLAKIIRATGRWSVDGDIISLDKLNVDGYLYSVDRASRGHTIRAHFRFPEDDEYLSTFGLICNFFHDAESDANGICAYYEDGLIYLSTLRGGVFETELDNATVVLEPDTWYWMEMSFHDGNISVFYGEDLLSLTREINYVYEEADYPWTREDQIGRGALFVRNYTPHSMGYPFSSSDMIIPVHDNSTFPMADLVIVDDEIIQYSGKSANGFQDDLTYLTGDPMQGNTNDSGNYAQFADDRDQVAVIQTIALEDNFNIAGVKVYAKRHVGQTDGMVVAIYQGPRSAKKPIGTKIVSTTISASELAETGQWIEATFYSPVLLSKANSYWIVLHREDNPTHPEGGGLYVGIGASYPGELFKFDEDSDDWISQSSDMMFELLGSQLSNSWQIIVGGLTPPTDSIEFNNMALVAVGGSGFGEMFKVLGYGGAAGAGHLLFIDRDPSGLVGADTTFVLAPTLIVVARGTNDTEATFHGETMVSVWRDLSVESDMMHYFSHEQDMRLADAISELCSKAGAEFADDKEFDGLITVPSGTGLVNGEIGGTVMVVRGDNPIVKWTIPEGESGICWGMNESLTDGMAATVTDAGELTVYSITAGVFTPVSKMLGTEGIYTALEGEVATISVFENFVSFWVSGYFINTLVHSEATVGTACVFIGDTPGDINVDWSQLWVRKDNVIFDMGGAGSQILGEITKERRVFFQDDQYGRLRAFTRRKSISNYEWALSVAGARVETDNDFVSRLRLVGADIYEGYDLSQLTDYGNVFRLRYSQILDTESEHRMEVIRSLLDASRTREHYTFMGAIDPRVECNDILSVRSRAFAGQVVVDNIDLNVSISSDEVVSDMTIQASLAPEAQMIADVIIGKDTAGLDWTEGLEYPITIYEKSIVRFRSGEYGSENIRRYEYTSNGLSSAIADLGMSEIIYIPEGTIVCPDSDIRSIPKYAAIVGAGPTQTILDGWVFTIRPERGSRIEGLQMINPTEHGELLPPNILANIIVHSDAAGTAEVRNCKFMIDATDKHASAIVVQNVLAQDVYFDIRNCSFHIVADGTTSEFDEDDEEHIVDAKGTMITHVMQNFKPTINVYSGLSVTSGKCVRDELFLQTGIIDTTAITVMGMIKLEDHA